MTTINAIVKLNTTTSRYGIREQNLSKTGNSRTGAVSKLEKVLGLRERKDQSVPSKKEKKIQPIDAEPKPYGSHGGNAHAAILARFSGEIQDLKVWLNYVNNAIAKLESRPNLDLTDRMERYNSTRDRLAREALQRYGSNTDGEGYQFYYDNLISEAFSYKGTRITIILWSDEHFPGSEEDKERGIFVSAFRSKTITSYDLLDSTELVELIKLAKGEILGHSIKRRQPIAAKIQQSGESYRLKRISIDHAVNDDGSSGRESTKRDWKDVF